MTSRFCIPGAGTTRSPCRSLLIVMMAGPRCCACAHGIVPGEPSHFADVIVSAELSSDGAQPDSKVKIREVLWSASDKDRPAAGDEVDVFHLPECKTANHGWSGGGTYVLALKQKGRTLAGMEIPLAPGFPAGDAESRDKFPRLRIYRASEDALQQAQDLAAARKKVAESEPRREKVHVSR